MGVDLDVDSVTFVIRSVGERTEGQCRATILSQGIPAHNVVTIHEAPFAQAMRVGFEIGIDAGRPWTFCVDADVILREGAIATMLDFAARQPANVFEVQGFVLDKLMFSLRMAGNHLFRTSHLDRMIACIPEKDVFRPETEAMRQMVREGLRWRPVPYVAGLHDFGQFNRDIFRKCFTHSQKHLHLLPKIVSGMRRRATEDPDFRVALLGIAEGLRAESDVTIDVRHKPFRERFEALQIPEKPEMEPGALGLAYVEQTLQEWAQEDDLGVRGLPMSAGEAIALDGRRELGRLAKLRAIMARRGPEIGPARFIPFAVGTGLELLGQRLKARKANKL